MKRTIRIGVIVLISLALMLLTSWILSQKAAQEGAGGFFTVRPSSGAAQISAEGCVHEWENGVCRVCGTECLHEWENGVCTICGYHCPHMRHDAQTLVCMTCGAVVGHSYVDGICSCGAEPEFVYDKKDFPTELLEGSEQKGTLEKFVFDVNDLVVKRGQRSSKTERGFIVYTPYGYDRTKQYNVLLLTHAAGNSCHDWLTIRHIFSVDYPRVYGSDVLDAMIALGYVEPLIVVSVEYRNLGRPDEVAAPFGEELRNCVLPFIVKNYSTYASIDENGELVPARRHFGIAGASFGSMVLWGGMIADCSDLFAYWGCFSGNVATVEEMCADISAAAEAGYTPDYILAAGGTNEISTRADERRVEEAIDASDYLLRGGNAIYLVLQGGDHNYSSWNVCMYNCLQVFFRNIHAR